MEFCEYCGDEAVIDNSVLGNVCEDCFELALENEEEFGIFAVDAEEDYDLIRDAQEGF